MVCFSNEKRKQKKTVKGPDITMDDIHQRNFNPDPSWTSLKYLESVVEVALDKYEEAKNHDDNDSGDDQDVEGDQENYFLKKRKLKSEKLLKKPMMVPTLIPTLKFKTKDIRETGDEEKYCFFSRKEKSKKRAINVAEEENHPELPQEFRVKIKELNCPKEAVFLIQKSLTSTDAAKDQSRLSMPFGQLKNDFLKFEEKIKAKTDGLKVKMFIEPSLKESEMVLRWWDMKKKKGKTSSMYTMINNWNEVRKRNGLEAGDFIQVWAFRDEEEKLGLALVRVSGGGGENCGVLAATGMEGASSGNHV